MKNIKISFKLNYIPFLLILYDLLIKFIISSDMNLTALIFI